MFSYGDMSASIVSSDGGEFLASHRLRKAPRIMMAVFVDVPCYGTEYFLDSLAR